MRNVREIEIHVDNHSLFYPEHYGYDLLELPEDIHSSTTLEVLVH